MSISFGAYSFEGDPLENFLQVPEELGFEWNPRRVVLNLWILWLENKYKDISCFSEFIDSPNESALVYYQETNELISNGFEKNCITHKRFKLGGLSIRFKKEAKLEDEDDKSEDEDEEETSSHANAILFDNYCHTLVRFEPHGKRYTGDFSVDININEKLEEFAKQKLGGAKYISPADYETEEGSQHDEPLCIVWSLMFLHYVLKLEKDQTMCMVKIEPLLETIVSNYLTNDNALILREKVYKYAGRIMREFPELYNEHGKFNFMAAKKYINSQPLVVECRSLEKVKKKLEDSIRELKLSSIASCELLFKTLKNKQKFSMIPDILDTIYTRLKINHSLKIEQVSALAKGLSTNKTVKSLDLEFCEIDNDGAIALANALKVNNHITGVITLRHNSIGDLGAQALAEAFKTNTSIEGDIYLNHNSIGDTGMTLLCAAFWDDEKYKVYDGTLYFGFNNVQDEGLGARSLKSLSETMGNRLNVTSSDGPPNVWNSDE